MHEHVYFFLSLCQKHKCQEEAEVKVEEGLCPVADHPVADHPVVDPFVDQVTLEAKLPVDACLLLEMKEEN